MEKWPISLPIYKPEVFDNSALETFSRCPRRWLYRYGMRRAPSGENYPINFGLAYHKYREVVEDVMREEESSMTPVIHALGVAKALEGFENPPAGHRHEFLNISRLGITLALAHDRIVSEQEQGAIQVVRSEDSFDLELPWACPYCECEELPELVEDVYLCKECRQEVVPPERYGGRMDQVVDWRGKLWIRDFKTTSRMGNTYPQQFSPNNQMSGYVWAGEKLSGRPVKGVIIETVYNTKTQGPEIKQFLSTRSPGQIDTWLNNVFHEATELRACLDA